jgi:hypothetical protein
LPAAQFATAPPCLADSDRGSKPGFDVMIAMFQRFLPIFGEKMVFFLNTNVMMNFSSTFSFVLSQKHQFFAKFFDENI